MQRRKTDSLTHAIHLEEMHEMENFVPMTLPERNRLRKWVYSGHGVDENPWHYRDHDGYELNYIDGYRRHLAEKWGEFYRPFYRVIRTDRLPYEECIQHTSSVCFAEQIVRDAKRASDLISYIIIPPIMVVAIIDGESFFRR